ncbi:glycosyltransferase family 4 protein [Dietzia sp. SLG510A3-30A2]|nr:glycosyltransferase family 4 protein [Dietzia sp. SLG510A3-30A2]
MKSVLIACAYFDWFSNYQEVALANALKEFADVHVIAGDRVNPIFSDAHIDRLRLKRCYPVGTTQEDGITVSRFKIRELRSMSFSLSYMKAASRTNFDVVIQVTPGFILPVLASKPQGKPARVVLYGDNTAMYENLPPLQRKIKRAIFSATKGLIYRYCNSGATIVCCYTPDTVDRIRPFLAGAPVEVLPLSYDRAVFSYSEDLRRTERDRLGFADSDTVLITAGKAYHTKRVQLLVQAFDLLAQQNSSLRLVIAGMIDGSGSQEVRSAIETSPFKDRITSLPLLPTKQLNGLFNAGDIGIWPIMPAVTIQQAMGTGLPVVLPDNNIVGHLLKQPESGIYYTADLDAPYALKAAIERVLQRPRIEGSARHALARQNSWLSSQTIASRILSLADTADH